MRPRRARRILATSGTPTPIPRCQYRITRPPRTLSRRLLATAITVAATFAFGAAATQAHAQVVANPPIGCPPMCRQASHPLNPALKCVPDYITSAVVRLDGPQPIGCPDGWKQAVPPLNPALKCVPGFITSGLHGTDDPPPVGCPEGWIVAAPPSRVQFSSAAFSAS